MFCRPLNLPEVFKHWKEVHLDTGFHTLALKAIRIFAGWIFLFVNHAVQISPGIVNELSNLTFSFRWVVMVRVDRRERRYTPAGGLC